MQDRLDLKSPFHETKLFLDENGMLGLAPEAIKVGDQICHSDNSNQVAIIRKKGALSEVVTTTTKASHFPAFAQLLETTDKELKHAEVENIHQLLTCHQDFVTSNSNL
jgi:hypothetical protein